MVVVVVVVVVLEIPPSRGLADGLYGSGWVRRIVLRDSPICLPRTSCPAVWATLDHCQMTPS